MTILTKNIIPAKQAEAAQTGQYTAINCKTVIDKFTATNTTGSNVVISVNLIPSGGAASASNLIVQARPIAPGSTYSFPELVGQVLEAGGVISTLAGTAAALTISAAGREIT